MSALENQRFYAAAWLLTHYAYSTTERRAQLMSYVNDFRRGVPSVEAFEKAFGMKAGDMPQELGRYARFGMPFIVGTRAARPKASMVVTTLDDAEGDALLPMLRLERAWGSSEDEGREAALTVARRVAGKHPGTLAAARLLAFAEATAGKDQAARDAAAAALKAIAAPDDALSLYILGRVELEAARDSEDGRAERLSAARKAFVKAHRLSPTHYQTLYRYAETFSFDDGPMTENTLNTLLLARQLAPQVNTITLRAGAALLGAGRREDAIALLEPIVYSPHNRGAAASARAMLEKAGWSEADVGAEAALEPTPAPAP